jgi:hypothetical protein
MKKGSKAGLHKRKGNMSLLTVNFREKQLKHSKSETMGCFFNKFGDKVYVLKNALVVKSKKK